MASSPLVWTPDKRMKLQAAAADLSPEAFQAVVGKVFGPATLAMRRRWSPRDVDFEGLEAASCESMTKALNEIHAQKHEPARRASVDSVHQFALGAPTVKSCGGPVMAHNTNTKIFLKRAGRGRKKAVLQHSPFMPYGDCEFSITAAGVVDAVDG